MRIALIAPPWLPVPPPAYGGTEAVIDLLARGLRDAGHDVVLFATGDSGSEVPVAWLYEQAIGTTGMHPHAEVAHVLAARDHPGVLGADIVHDHTIVGPAGVGWQPEGAVPIVTTNHGPFRGACGRVYREAARRGVHVVAISAHQASTARGTPIAQVIHHGIDVDRVALGAGGGEYVAVVGRMAPAKGIARACRIARAAGVPLRIAAKMHEPDEQRYFAEVVEPLLGDGIEYVGELGPVEKTALYRDAACLLNPIAWDEPFGLVMVEAMACGTPVVATIRGSAPEIVEDGVTGHLGRSDEELVAGVRAAMRLDRAAVRARCAERFGAARMVADHLALYARLLGAPVDEEAADLLGPGAAR